MLTQPGGGDVHRTADIRDLPLRVAALADHDGPGMSVGAKARRDTEFLRVGCGQLCDFAFSGEQTA
jgi:hypothetical protein